MDFRVLGVLEVRVEGTVLPLGEGRQTRLLAALVQRAPDVVPADVLLGQVWDDPPASAGNNLQATVSRLRRVLGPDRVVSRSGGYSLRLADDELDSDRFTALAGEADAALARGDAGRARALLDSALGLWRGPAYADVRDLDWARAEAVRLDERRLSAIEARIEAELALGRHAAVIGELDGLVGDHPYREGLCVQLMLALYRSGRQAEALAVFQRTRTTLVDELGVEPGGQLQRLVQAILLQDSSLDLAPVKASVKVPATPREMEAAELQPVTLRTTTTPTGPSLDVPARGSATQQLDGPFQYGTSEPAPAMAGAGTGPALRRPRRALAVTAVVLLFVTATVLSTRLAGRGRGLEVDTPPDSVVAVDAQGHAVTDVPVGARPGALLATGTTVWVTNIDDESLSRVDSTTGRVVRTVPVGAPPAGLASSGTDVWVSRTDNRLATVDTAYDSITTGHAFPTYSFAIDTVRPLAYGLGSLWYVDPGGVVAQVDPRTERVTATFNVGTDASSVAVGFGSIWVANTSDGTISRIDPRGAASVVVTIPVGHEPRSIAVGSAAVWVVTSEDGMLLRIDPETDAIDSTTRVGGSPVAVAVGAGGVWVAQSRADSLTRVDASGIGVTAVVHLRGSPSALTTGGSVVWASITAPAAAVAPSAGTLRVTLNEEPQSLDPAVDYTSAGAQISYATCLKLLNYPDVAGPLGTRLVPEAAESVPVPSDGGRTYTFRIRPGYAFAPPSNSPVTAKTFAHTIERALTARLNGPALPYLSDIVGVPAYEAGRARHVSGISTDGASLTIRLTHPVPAFLSRLSLPTFCVVPDGTPAVPDIRQPIPSAGPYTVSSYTPGQQLVLVRNPNYHGPRPHNASQIIVGFGVGSAEAVRDVESGRTDYTSAAFTPSAVERLQRLYGAGGRFTAGGRNGIRYLVLNASRPTFANQTVRRAVSLAVDRTALVGLQSQYNSDFGHPPFEKPTSDLLPGDVPGYLPGHVYPLRSDLAAARRLMAGRRLSAVLYSCSAAPCPQQAAVITANLAAIGITVTTKVLAKPVIFQQLGAKRPGYDIVVFGWVPDYPDPENVLVPLLDGRALNTPDGVDFAHFNDPSVNRRLEAAARLSGARRFHDFGQLAIDLAREGVPLVAFAAESDDAFYAAGVECRIDQPVYGPDLAALCRR